ncbi:MAG: hypothetical protein IJG64_03685 [Oscillospiraceae bacterium]|nr:hypothetical protein [Oscillospiraceae bacterium]MBQ6578977.1 hypothetical protein [Bacteroidales bacterium]
MPINQFKDYAQTKAYTDFQTLPKGGYVMQIKGATVKNNSVGQYVEIFADVAEGEYANYFTKDYESQKQGEDRKWRCRFFLNVPKDDGSEKDGWTKRHFKTFTEALEESNPGYHFDWDESRFKGLLIGGLFNIRQYEKNDGSIGESTNFAQVTTVDKIRSGDFRLPKDKLFVTSGSGAISSDGFMKIPEGVDEELPF